MTNHTEPVAIGTEIPMGGATGLQLVGTVVAVDEISAKVHTPWFDQWYPHAQLRALLRLHEGQEAQR